MDTLLDTGNVWVIMQTKFRDYQNFSRPKALTGAGGLLLMLPTAYIAFQGPWTCTSNKPPGLLGPVPALTSLLNP